MFGQKITVSSSWTASWKTCNTPYQYTIRSLPSSRNTTKPKGPIHPYSQKHELHDLSQALRYRKLDDARKGGLPGKNFPQGQGIQPPPPYKAERTVFVKRSEFERRRKFSEFSAGEKVAMGRQFPQPEAQILSKIGIPTNPFTKKPQAKLVLPNMIDNYDKFYPPIQSNKNRRTEPAHYLQYAPSKPPASANPPSFPYYVHSKAQALIPTPPESNFIPPTTWGLSIVHNCAIGVVTAVLVGGAICDKIVHGVSTVGGFIYANRETIQERCATYTVAVRSSYNAAKRRLVSIQTTQASLSRPRFTDARSSLFHITGSPTIWLIVCTTNHPSHCTRSSTNDVRCSSSLTISEPTPSTNDVRCPSVLSIFEPGCDIQRFGARFEPVWSPH